MLECTEKIHTPVRIEYNIPTGTQEFNMIEESRELFDIMSTEEPYMRILNGRKDQVLWEKDMNLPEETQFVELFSMREQTFRRGHKKISIYCTVESTQTINRLKFKDPLQTYLSSKNVWIKPDLYATKAVSSPGFLTLLHPRITNKKELMEDMKRILSQTKVSQEEDQVIHQWQQAHSYIPTEGATLVPPFHLETSLRKWGEIKVEVISVYCKQEDAQYLKSLLVEASSQNLILKGLFIPTGLHLIEGKEVLTNLLREHSEYLQSVTSVQIDGISTDDMYREESDEGNIEQLLMDGPGVSAIERTFQTDYRGQWLVVVKQTELQDLGKYISENLHRIYKHKKGKKSKMVEDQSTGNQKGYRLFLIDNSLSRVGSYAEALKKRFPLTQRTDTKTQAKDQLGEQWTFNETQGKGYEPKFRGAKVDNTNSWTKTPQTKRVLQSEHQSRQSHRENDSDNASQHEHNSETTESFLNNSKNIAQNSTVRSNLGALTASQVETMFQQKIEELNQINKKSMETIQQSIEDTLDDMLERKLRKATNMMANSVTYKIITSFQKMFNKENKKTATTTDTEVVTQDITSNDTEVVIQQTQKTDQHTNCNTDTTNIQMMNAILQIEEQTNTPTDSTHDASLLESSTSPT